MKHEQSATRTYRKTRNVIFKSLTGYGLARLGGLLNNPSRVRQRARSQPEDGSRWMAAKSDRIAVISYRFMELASLPQNFFQNGKT